MVDLERLALLLKLDDPGPESFVLSLQLRLTLGIELRLQLLVGMLVVSLLFACLLKLLLGCLETFVDRLEAALKRFLDRFNVAPLCEMRQERHTY